MQEIQKGRAPALPAIVHKRSQMIKDADAHIYFHLELQADSRHHSSCRLHVLSLNSEVNSIHTSTKVRHFKKAPTNQVNYP